jgi:uncharacterized protein (TIGR02231 family)
MKHLFLLPLLLIICITTNAANDITLQTKAKHITVYPNTAEISRSTNFNFEKGIQNIVFDSLTPYLLSNSIQAQGYGDFVILDVKFSMRQPNPLDQTQKPLPLQIQKEIKFLQDSIRLKTYTQQEFNNQLEVLQLEKNILLNNQLVRGNGGDTIPELKQTMDFFRIKLNDINTQIIEVNRKEFPVNSEIQRMNTRLSELNSYNQRHNPTINRQAVPQITIQILGNKAGSGKMDLSYLVNNASWYASYDIRATDKEEIQLIYKANIQQNTGISWKNVEMTLSTLNPNQQYTKPVLPIWYTNYSQISTIETTNVCSQSRNQRRSKTDAPMTEDAEEYAIANNAWNYTQAVSSMLNVEYQINLNYNIPSDGQYHTLPMQNKKLGANFKYYAAPKLDNKAYLIAKITDWQTMDLLQGQTNIYFNGRFTGQTNIYPQSVKDSMELTLGRTNGIRINRKKISEKEEPQLVGSWATKTVHYQIIIKNNQARNIKLTLEDLIPHSTDENIEIKLIKDGNATFNKDNSHLLWDLSIASSQSKTIDYTFTVKYDKKKPLNLQF